MKNIRMLLILIGVICSASGYADVRKSLFERFYGTYGIRVECSQSYSEFLCLENIIMISRNFAYIQNTYEGYLNILKRLNKIVIHHSFIGINSSGDVSVNGNASSGEILDFIGREAASYAYYRSSAIRMNESYGVEEVRCFIGNCSGRMNSFTSAINVMPAEEKSLVRNLRTIILDDYFEEVDSTGTIRVNTQAPRLEIRDFVIEQGRAYTNFLSILENSAIE